MGAVIGWLVAFTLVFAGIGQAIARDFTVDGWFLLLVLAGSGVAAVAAAGSEASRQIDRDLGEVERHRL